MKKCITMLAILPLAIAFIGCDDGLSGNKGYQADLMGYVLDGGGLSFR